MHWHEEICFVSSTSLQTDNVKAKRKFLQRVRIFVFSFSFCHISYKKSLVIVGWDSGSHQKHRKT